MSQAGNLSRAISPMVRRGIIKYLPYSIVNKPNTTPNQTGLQKKKKSKMQHAITKKKTGLQS
jgi:hypothetical protein